MVLIVNMLGRLSIISYMLGNFPEKKKKNAVWDFEIFRV